MLHLWSDRQVGTIFFTAAVMEKMKNGDHVIYKDRVGVIYGKPRETKFGGMIYTIKIGNDYVKATPSELSVNKSVY